MVQTVRTLFSGLAALAGLLAWIGAGILAGYTALYWTRVDRAEGVVVSLHQVPCWFASTEVCPDPVVLFETPERGPVTFKASDAGALVALEARTADVAFTQGQTVPVLYERKQPSRARVATPGLLWRLPVRLLGLGALLILVAYLFRPGRPVGELGILRDRFGR